ncbi:MAG: helix-turn-helix transcriptional regulator [Burkholderiales bacterium]
MASQIFIRLPEVRRLTGFSRSEIYRLIGLQRFPAQIPLGERAVAWIESEVVAWIESRINASRPEKRVAG